MKPWRLRLSAVIVATALGLTGYASGSGGSSPLASGPPQPIRIGVLFTSTDSLDPVTATSPGSILPVFSVYDSLAVMTKRGTALFLAEPIEPNATADEWTVTLRDGFTYSSDAAATGQDVLDSLSCSAQFPSYATSYSGIDLEASSAFGPTATLKLKKPASDFLESSLEIFSAIAPKGKLIGIGAGSFVIDKRDPGAGYRLHANDKYWDDTPSILQVTITSIPDSTAQANVLHTNEIDFTTSFNLAALTILPGAPNIKVADVTLESASVLELALSIHVAPFSDPEVRCAAELVVDRDKLVNTVPGSTGEVTSDMPGEGYDNYPEDVAQIVTNKEEAEHIFMEKGVMPLTVVAAGVIPDMVSSAESMAQELVKAGVRVIIDKHDLQTYYSNLEKLHQVQAATAFWINRSPITGFHSQVMPDYPFNLPGLTSGTIQQNLAKVTATLDTAEQKKLVGEINKGIHDQGDDLIWGYQKQVSAYRAGLENFTSVQSVPWLTRATFNPAG